MSGPFWSVVKTNLAPEGSSREQVFNDWWDDHAAEYVAKDGFLRGWRLRAIEHPGAIGSPAHRYLAVYEVEAISAFNRALEEGTESHPGDPWGPWQEYVDRYLLDWERTYYRLIGEREGDAGTGGFWAVVMVDFEDPDGLHEQRFDHWYDTVHLPEICSHPGVHRGRRLRVEPDANDLGPHRQRFWAVYEVDRPDSFAAARRDRADRGIEPWDGVWLPYVRNFEIAFYEVLMAVDHDEAVAGQAGVG